MSSREASEGADSSSTLDVVSAGGATTTGEKRRSRLLEGAEKTVLSAEFVEALEKQATDAANQLALHISALHVSLNSVTALSVANMETFRLSADNSTAAVASSVAQMHTFLTKCQQLNQDLPPIDDLARQVKELRRTLDQMEMLVLRFGRS